MAIRPSSEAAASGIATDAAGATAAGAAWAAVASAAAKASWAASALAAWASAVECLVPRVCRWLRCGPAAGGKAVQRRLEGHAVLHQREQARALLPHCLCEARRGSAVVVVQLGQAVEELGLQAAELGEVLGSCDLQRLEADLCLGRPDPKGSDNRVLLAPTPVGRGRG